MWRRISSGYCGLRRWARAWAVMGACALAFPLQAVEADPDTDNAYRTSSGTYRVRVEIEDRGGPALARERALETIRAQAIKDSPQLVTVTRLQAGEDYSERVRAIGAGFVQTDVIAEYRREEGPRSFLVLEARATLREIDSRRIEDALQSDRELNIRLRNLERENVELHARIQGLPASVSASEQSQLQTRARVDAVLADHSNIRQTFQAGELERLGDRGEITLEAAERIIQEQIIESLKRTTVRARLIAMGPPSREFTRQGRYVEGYSSAAEADATMVARVDVSWTLEEPLEHYGKILGRWFNVRLEAGEGRPEPLTVCVSENDRHPYARAAELFRILGDKYVKAEIKLMGQSDPPGQDYSAAYWARIAGGRNFVEWCIARLPSEERKFPLWAIPGLYERAKGDLGINELPVRMGVKRALLPGITHLEARIVGSRPSAEIK